jgi:carbamoyltransferase
MKHEQDSPYMLLVASVRDSKRIQQNNPAENLKGLDKLKVKRSTIPAITHVDYSARIQTVDSKRHPKLHKLMSRFMEKTGCPVIINTSFNIRGEPIVCTPQDAYRCFMATNMDVLVMENQLLFKEEQPQAKQHEIDEYKAQFELD